MLLNSVDLWALSKVGTKLQILRKNHTAEVLNSTIQPRQQHTCGKYLLYTSIGTTGQEGTGPYCSRISLSHCCQNAATREHCRARTSTTTETTTKGLYSYDTQSRKSSTASPKKPAESRAQASLAKLSEIDCACKTMCLANKGRDPAIEA